MNLKAIVIGSIFAILIAGCSPRMESLEKAAEIVQDIAAQVDVEEDNFEGQDSQQLQDIVTWQSKGIPDVFPEYTGGDVVQYPWHADSWPNFVPINNASLEAIEEYVEKALTQGYTLQWEKEQMGDEDMSWALNLEKEDAVYNILINYYEEEGRIFMILGKNEK